MTKSVKVGNLIIGGGAPVSIQSMTNTDTRDAEKTLQQIAELAKAGADLVRISVPDTESAETVKIYAKNSPVPLCADIHYDEKVALIAMENGIQKLRVNPSNLSAKGIVMIADSAKEKGIPIRVGVNQGSVRRECTPEELAELALQSAEKFERVGHDQLVLAVKSSSVSLTVAAYRTLGKRTDYPLHIGLTEAGTANGGLVKSSVAIGALLLDGIGDTVRVSLAGNPIREVEAAKKILAAVGQRKIPEVIACPTCARTQIAVEEIAKKLEEKLCGDTPVKVAVMGCAVNGIGEAQGADFGVCGGKERSVIFQNGEILMSIPNDKIMETLLEMAENYHG